MRHFDAVGRVPEVFKRLDTAVPRLFPGESKEIIPVIKHNLTQYAAENRWEFVVVSLSSGMARLEMDEFLGGDVKHNGVIVIDPTASTHQHQTYSSRKLARIQKERLIKLNEGTGDVMVIMFGMDKLDRDATSQLLMRRLRMMGGSLEMIEKNIDTNKLGDMPKKMAFVQQQKLKEVRKRLKQFGIHRETGSTEEHSGESTLAMSADFFVILALTYQMLDYFDDPAMRDILHNIEMQAKSIPEEFKSLGISYEPYERMANNLMDKEEARISNTQGMNPPDVRDLSGDGKVDPGNKYASAPGGPQPKPE
jgi:hypothetical protein